MENTKSIRDRLRGLHALVGPYRPDKAPLPNDPTELFIRWIEAAIAAGEPEPHAMTLSTVIANRRPDARVLLLKDVDAQGWHFASTKNGVKGRQIAANPSAALTFYWPMLGRQVRIRGTIQELGPEAAGADFAARTAGAKAVALMERQSQALTHPPEVDTEFSKQRARLDAEPDLVAPGWTVYVLAASEVEFWQGDEERRHWRLKYLKDGDRWFQTRLWP
jgi:pyridoxamine 5'-phosphate oxidase